jgi:hypothetical protein
VIKERLRLGAQKVVTPGELAGRRSGRAVVVERTDGGERTEQRIDVRPDAPLTATQR